jgi:hypothetical protein
MIIPKKIHSKVNYSAWWLKKLHGQSLPASYPAVVPGFTKKTSYIQDI